MSLSLAELVKEIGEFVKENWSIILLSLHYIILSLVFWIQYCHLLNEIKSQMFMSGCYINALIVEFK